MPGLTRAALPLLARRGVRALSVGENSQCAPMAVPPIFRWRDNATGVELLALFHGLGYGGSWPSRRRLHDMGPPRPGVNQSRESRSEACVAVEAAGVALCYAWKLDNTGPVASLPKCDLSDCHNT